MTDIFKHVARHQLTPEFKGAVTRIAMAMESTEVLPRARVHLASILEPPFLADSSDSFPPFSPLTLARRGSIGLALVNRQSIAPYSDREMLLRLTYPSVPMEPYHPDAELFLGLRTHKPVTDDPSHDFEGILVALQRESILSGCSFRHTIEAEVKTLNPLVKGSSQRLNEAVRAIFSPDEAKVLREAVAKTREAMRAGNDR